MTSPVHIVPHEFVEKIITGRLALDRSNICEYSAHPALAVHMTSYIALV
jgi:hypothetical protein